MNVGSFSGVLLNSNHPPIVWKQMCYPKFKGGHGIRPATWLNQAVITNLAWKNIIEPDNWWGKRIELKYLRSENFFFVTTQSPNSLAWKWILDSRPLILEGMHWLVGNGFEINFWTFNWCYHFPLYNLVLDHKIFLLDISLTVDMV